MNLLSALLSSRDVSFFLSEYFTLFPRPFLIRTLGDVSAERRVEPGSGGRGRASCTKPLIYLAEGYSEARKRQVLFREPPPASPHIHTLCVGHAQYLANRCRDRVRRGRRG